MLEHEATNKLKEGNLNIIGEIYLEELTTDIRGNFVSYSIIVATHYYFYEKGIL